MVAVSVAGLILTGAFAHVVKEENKLEEVTAAPS
jgi:hypothetical protein